MSKTSNGGNAATGTKAPVHVFNTMKAANRLQEAGLPRPQAEATVEVVDGAVSAAITAMCETMATKADLKVAVSALETQMVKWFVRTLIAVSGLVVAAVGILIAVLG